MRSLVTTYKQKCKLAPFNLAHPVIKSIQLNTIRFLQSPRSHKKPRLPGFKREPIWELLKCDVHPGIQSTVSTLKRSNNSGKSTVLSNITLVINYQSVCGDVL